MQLRHFQNPESAETDQYRQYCKQCARFCGHLNANTQKVLNDRQEALERTWGNLKKKKN